FLTWELGYFCVIVTIAIYHGTHSVAHITKNSMLHLDFECKQPFCKLRGIKMLSFVKHCEFSRPNNLEAHFMPFTHQPSFGWGAILLIILGMIMSIALLKCLTGREV
ncbi:MAG: hypothetical protein KAH96_06860, partial [Alphaproteobacteria bacterium]|nr:hypothetical protein [Alphaproteobacteria bacterium]